ncbi:complement C1r-B subcomponent-like [Hyperolius riggenbachi]|uniref:complement C1r-B subcomponent-like n=1 Tax=Hyperolius riggenbachi TaxID=752182 RepID=UPI0035A2C2CC
MFILVFLFLGGVSSSSEDRKLCGFITSPDYPETYPNNYHSTFHIAVPDGYHISFTFQVFGIKPSERCTSDYVKVSADDKELGRFCGHRRYRSHPGHRSFVSTGSQMEIEFHSELITEDYEDSMFYQGFQAYYQAVDNNECTPPHDSDGTWTPPCQHFCNNYIGGFSCSCRPGYELQSDKKSCKSECSQVLFTEKAGIINSPRYPHTYPEDLRCNYRVRVVENLNITLSFLEFFDVDEQQAGGCPYDILKVFAGGTLLGSYCGRRSPGMLETHSHEVDLVFQTDDYGENRGWKLRYTTGDVDCGAPQSIYNGEVRYLSTNHTAEARYSCKSEYYTLSGEETYSCSLDGRWLNHKGQSEPPTCKPACGRTTLQSTSRILGGADARDGNFPWMVLFPIESLGLGGGSLISDQWVLTAAHVVQDNPEPRMRVGNVKPQHAKDLEGKRVILHPDWVVEDADQRKNFDNDIALVQLSHRVEMGPCVSLVCLPGEGEGFSPVVDKRGYIAGWGKKSDTQKRLRSPILQYAPIFVRETAECKASEKTDQAFTENMFCAGGFGKDSCGGDGGDPLMFEDQSDEVEGKKLFVGGIVSWGLGCGKFGMYTKVQNYLDWIRETIQKVELEEAGLNIETVKIC